MHFASRQLKIEQLSCAENVDDVHIAVENAKLLIGHLMEKAKVIKIGVILYVVKKTSIGKLPAFLVKDLD